MIRSITFILLFFAISISSAQQQAEKIETDCFKNLHKVSPIVFRSDQPCKKSKDFIDELGIKSVLSLRAHHNTKGEFYSDKIMLFRLRLKAHKLTEEDLLSALMIIRDAPKPILIHCKHGSDRTGAVIAAYRIVIEQWTKAQALDEFLAVEYGYHKNIFPKIEETINELDVEKLRAKLNESY